MEIYKLPTWAETTLVICVALMLAGLAAYIAMKAITEAIEAESRLERKRRASETKALNKWKCLYEEAKDEHRKEVAELLCEVTDLQCENKRMKQLLAKVKVADL